MIVDNEELEELARLAEDVASGLAQFAWDRRLEGISVTATKSSAVDVVTEADQEIERLAKARIRAARPQDGFLGEEGDSESGYSGLTWVVDPIDGTVNYLYGVGTCAVSVAVVSGVPDPSMWTPLAGCIAYIGQSYVYRAARGCGAYLNGKKIRVSDCADLSQALVATGFSYNPQIRAAQGVVAGRMLSELRDIRRIGAAAPDLASVAGGFLDGYFESDLHAWDMAAGSLIVREAGGVVEDLDGGPGNERLLIAGNPRIVALLRQALIDSGVRELLATVDATR